MGRSTANTTKQPKSPALVEVTFFLFRSELSPLLNEWGWECGIKGWPWWQHKVPFCTKCYCFRSVNLFALNRYDRVANFFRLVFYKKYCNEYKNTNPQCLHTGHKENSSSGFCLNTNPKQGSIKVFIKNMLSCEFALFFPSKIIKKNIYFQ